MNRKDVERTTILLCKSGSQVYRTNLPNSDTDYKGIFVQDSREWITGDLGHRVEQKENGFLTEEGSGLFPLLDGEKDVVIYEIRKYLSLARKANPNILEMLFLDETDYIHKDISAEMLIANRQHFLTKQMRSSFAGYANGQIHRMEQHRKWILEPPTHRPALSEFGFTDIYLPKTKEQVAEFIEFLWTCTRNAIEFLEPSEELRLLLLEEIDFKHLFKTQLLDESKFETVTKITGASDSYLHHIRRSQEYYKALHQWDCYQSWVKNRNRERFEIEKRIGYDCYSEDTEFLTQRGWLKYDFIRNSDWIASFNKQSLRLEWEKPISRTKQLISAKTPLYLLENKYTKTLVTENHNLFISKFARSGSYLENDFKLEKIKDVKEYSDFRVLSCLNSTEIDYPVDDEYLKLMGAYVTEGCLNFRKNKKSITIKSLRIEQKLGNRLCSYLEEAYLKGVFNCKYEINKTNRKNNLPDYKGLLYICSNNKILKQLCNDCGYSSDKKTLPLWVLDLSSRQIQLLLDVMLAADGTHKKMGDILYTTSKKLADAVQTMCVCNGKPSTIFGPYKSKYKFGDKDIYQVYIPKNHIKQYYNCSKSGKTITEYINDGSIKSVVCFETKNNTLITRKDNKIAFHGNSKHASHCIRLLRMALEAAKEATLIVNREVAGDADYLRKIRLGEVPYNEMKTECDKLFTELKETPFHSSIKDRMDDIFLKELCLDVLKYSPILV